MKCLSLKITSILAGVLLSISAAALVVVNKTGGNLYHLQVVVIVPDSPRIICFDHNKTLKNNAQFTYVPGTLAFACKKRLSIYNYNTETLLCNGADFSTHHTVTILKDESSTPCTIE